MTVREKALAAKAAAPALAALGENGKNSVLFAMAKALRDNASKILAQNAIDCENAKNRGISGSMLDRLALNEKRIEDMAAGIEHVATLPDPIGETVAQWRRPNGLQIGQVRVPLGVIGIIYEARPNVTADAISLCVKSGNAVVLRGGSEAILSNTAIVQAMVTAGEAAGMPAGAVQLITDTSRESATELMRQNGIIDVLIPRGGAGLIRSVVENASVPVIETGVGNCHVYVHSAADFDMARDIIINAKTSRPSVCNAAETMLVDEAIAKEFLPGCLSAIAEKGVEIRGCEKTREIAPWVNEASEADWETEYCALILAVKVVSGLDEALSHIAKYGTKHSEAIVTRDYFAAKRFLETVDAAAVYVNASTRFTDGFEFGFGAEIGISTQKLHARGPMGLKELTTIKYVVYGEGQIR